MVFLFLVTFAHYFLVPTHCIYSVYYSYFTMPPVYPRPYGASHNDRPPPPTRRNHYSNQPRFSQPGDDEFWEQVEYSHPSFPPTIDPNDYHPQVSSNYMLNPYH